MRNQSKVSINCS